MGLICGLLAVQLVAAACSPSGQSSVSGPLPLQAVALEGGEVLPERLLEPPVLNETQRLISLSRRQGQFCAIRTQIEDLPEPPPNDIEKLIQYGGTYHALLTVVDFRSQVDDPESARRKIRLPAEVVDAILLEQAAMWAFQIRVLTADALFDEKLIEEGELRVQSDKAFVHLANSNFGSAEVVLTEARVKYC